MDSKNNNNNNNNTSNAGDIKQYGSTVHMHASECARRQRMAQCTIGR